MILTGIKERIVPCVKHSNVNSR